MTDEDPFDRFDDVPERDGDPFAELDGQTDAADDTGTDAATTDPGVPDGDVTPGVADASAGDARADPVADRTGTDSADGTGERTAPFSQADGVDDGDPAAADAFQREDVASIDADAVWEQLGEARRGESAADQRDYAEVSKHSFCEQCEHFSAPPDVACAHEGTEILAFLDMETVRVVDCPVVADRRGIDERERL